MPDILDETLSDMGTMREAIAFRFWWYYHLTPVRNVDGIRQFGIITSQDKAAPPQAEKYLGADAGKIICLNPLGTKCVPNAVQVGPYICLALSIETLPHKIGLDWSYDGAVGIAQTLRDEQPSRPIRDIFLEAIYRWGSMVSYEPIRPDGLRVCCTDCLPHDPRRWPTLVSVSNEMLMQF
ncbi:hypothetical protein I6F36_22965 [Bradyrhizobium sp. BRP19]|uniref:hypothetical protein n=1 Tax=Bradyrhizobium sp. BRP19 TaxID=2793823 RepID=UPI001CD4E354|nr:hypothetical protein [Bradyrhizobium sp. BRP19]MCA1549697.1 hypothetical protein [Bradyrhizobium sp. BRP19]